MPDIYLTLVHHPVMNKRGEIVTTSVTNFDLHDLARTGKTYGIKKIFVMTPLESQRNMIHFIWDYWHDGFGATYNPDRKEAFEILQATENLNETRLTIKNLSGREPYLIATSALRRPEAMRFSDLKQRLKDFDRPLLLAFGTGHGLAEEFLTQCEATLEPVAGRGGYNHLPVRAAVAIILDRLLTS